MYCLREFVLRTTVILTPGACGREVPSGSPWTGSAGSGESAGYGDGLIFRPKPCNLQCLVTRVVLRYNASFDFFMTAPSKTPTFDSIFRQSTSKKALETYDSAADVPEKIEKRRTITSAAYEALGSCWPAVGSSGVLGELGKLL